MNIAAQLMLKEGYTEPLGLEDELQAYFNSVNYARSFISYIAVGAIFQNNDSIDSVVGLSLNSGQVDVPLGDEEIAVKGTLEWTVL